MSAAAPIKSDCIDFLGLMTAPKRSQVLAGSTPITYPAGSVAYMPGQPDYASVIVSGLARVYVASTSGRQATVYYFHRGELLCKGVVPGPPVRVHVQAVTETEVTSLDVGLLRDLAARDIEISAALLTNYVALLAHSAQIIAVRSFGDITERLAFDLLDRACRTQLVSGRLAVRASQQQLADSIGSVREVVARSLRKMKARVLWRPPPTSSACWTSKGSRRSRNRAPRPETQGPSGCEGRSMKDSGRQSA